MAVVLLSFKPTSMVWSPYKKFIFPEDREHFLNYIQASAQEDSTSRYEHKVEYDDNELIFDAGTNFEEISEKTIKFVLDNERREKLNYL